MLLKMFLQYYEHQKLALKIYSEEDKTLEIDVRDEGEVTASDITHDSDVEVLNPELKIATVSKGGHLKIRLVANKGRGYALAIKIILVIYQSV